METVMLYIAVLPRNCTGGPVFSTFNPGCTTFVTAVSDTLPAFADLATAVFVWVPRSVAISVTEASLASPGCRSPASNTNSRFPLSWDMPGGNVSETSTAVAVVVPTFFTTIL